MTFYLQWALGIILGGIVYAGEPSASPGKLLFFDDFERAEVGPEWRTSVKAFVIDGGVLKGRQTLAHHGAIAAIKAGAKDLIFEFKLRFEGSSSVNVVFDDKTFNGSHAGHLCRVAITPKQIRIGDDKEGSMRPDIMAMRKDPARKAEADKLLKGRSAAFPCAFEKGRWYAMRIELADDQIRVSADGHPRGTFKSPGIAHPLKTELHFTIGGEHTWIDEVRLWSAESGLLK